MPWPGPGHGRPRLVLGDAVAWIDTRADLVLGGVSDPGRVTQVNSSPYQMIGAADPVVGGGNGWFTLWTPSTAINLFSAGGNLTPMTVSNNRFLGEELSSDVTRVSADGRRYFVYPSIVRAVAAGGNIVLADNAAGYDNPVLLLAPSAGGQLEMLAGRSILANGAHAVSMSAADAPLPTPWRPAFSAFEVSNGNPILTNTSKDGVQPGSLGYNKPLFVFGPASPTNRALHAGDDTVARFYAVTGDILGLKSGAVVDMSNTGRSTDTWYEAAVPVSVRAGRDIMRLDVTALHNNARDLSLIEAGRDIIYANAQVAGPGTLLMQAARQVRQDDAASVRSLGAIVRGDNRLGADIAVLAGVGAAGPDYAGLLARYLDPTRALAAGETLGANPDRVVRSYGGEMTLANWLRLHFGYQGDEQGAQGELARQQAKVDAQAAADASRKRRDLSQDYRQESELHLVNWLRKQHGYEGGQDGAAAAFAALAPAARHLRAPAVLRRAEGRRPRVQRGRRPALRQLPARTPRHRGAVPRERCRRWSDPLRGQLHDVRRRGTAQQFRRQHPAADAGRPAGAGRGRRGPAGQRWRGDAGPGQHPALCAGQRAAGPEPHHDHLRRPHPGLVRERRHQRRARRQDHGAVHAAAPSTTPSAT